MVKTRTWKKLRSKPYGTDASQQRVTWVVNNADIVSILHAIRAELNVRYVMSHIVPTNDKEPFLYWLPFEWGDNGNPHVHGQCYVPGNPNFDRVVEDENVLASFLKEGHPDAQDLRTYCVNHDLPNMASWSRLAEYGEWTTDAHHRRPDMARGCHEHTAHQDSRSDDHVVTNGPPGDVPGCWGE